MDEHSIPKLDGFTWFVAAESDGGNAYHWEGAASEEEALEDAKSWHGVNDEVRIVYHGTTWRDAVPVYRVIPKITVTVEVKKLS